MIAKAISSIQNWKYIFKTLTKNKARSILTALGIIIGVWAVIVLVAIGNGLKEYINEQFESLGSNAVYVLPINEAQLQGQAGGFGAGFAISFDEKDVEKLKKIKIAKYVVPAASISNSLNFKNKDWIVELVGTAREFEQAQNFKPAIGRFFNSAEESRGKNVVVIGWKVKEELFKEEDPIDKRVKIDNKFFKVVGVIEQKGGGGLGSSMDNHALIPYKALWGLTEKKEFNFILVTAENKDQIGPLKEEIKTMLLKKYDKEDFSVTDQSQLLGTINKVLGVLTLGLAGIAAISLIVGGVGIMNVMLVSVQERTREVGLRKAVGATNSDILFQFLCESVILSLVGGIIGLIFAVIVTLIINRFFPAAITLWSIVLAIAVSAAVGIVFGITPARKASKLAPVDALRYE